MSFNNKIVWITGASSGIGEELVYAFAKQGAKIILSARRESELKRVADQSKLSKENFLILPFDLAELKNANDLTQQVINKFERIDFLINNGGQSQRSLVLETSEEVERKLMDTNYFGHVALTKSVLPFMVKQHAGKIIVISSIAGKFGFYLRSTYSAAKHALHGYFESLRLELEEEGISVLMVCPGKINTEVSVNAATATGGKNEKMEQSHTDGMSAARCSEIIIAGINSNKEEILIGGKEIKAVGVKKIFPQLFGKIIRKQKPY